MNVEEHNADVRFAYLIEVLTDSIATEGEATNQETQRSAEKRLVEQNTKAASAKQPAAPAPAAKPKAKPKTKAGSSSGKKPAPKDTGSKTPLYGRGAGARKLASNLSMGNVRRILLRTSMPLPRVPRRRRPTRGSTRI